MYTKYEYKNVFNAEFYLRSGRFVFWQKNAKDTYRGKIKIRKEGSILKLHRITKGVKSITLAKIIQTIYKKLVNIKFLNGISL